MAIIPLQNSKGAGSAIIDSRHPMFATNLQDWEKWRLTYEGGTTFRDRYLERLTSREDAKEFAERKKLSPIPTVAKAALNDIRNSIFQRMRDITRVGGSTSYMDSVNGRKGGVDRHGLSMNAFIGQQVLTDLLVMGKVGVYVDMPPLDANSSRLSDTVGRHPYLYHYAVEDILNYRCSAREDVSEFQALLLQDTCVEFDQLTKLPLRTFQRFRSVFINEDTGKVNVEFFNEKGEQVDLNNDLTSQPIELGLTRIPFVLLDIGDSLLKDICDHQIVIMNLMSANVNYDRKANFPFYVEQRDLRAGGSHLKQGANEDGTATAGGQGADDRNVKVGAVHGRAYDRDTDQPAFINPDPGPLKASREFQRDLADQVRELVNLAVRTLASRESAESKALDNQGLEAGLSYIGLLLESGEQKLAEYWAAYEEQNPLKRTVASIKYPEQYSLKTDTQRIEEATKLGQLIDGTPSRTARKELWKASLQTLLTGRISHDRMDSILNEIDKARFTTSDMETIIKAKEAGLVGEQTASMALGFEENEYLLARADHILRTARLLEAQQDAAGDPASRGADDLSTDPANAGKREKELSRNTDTRADTTPRVRGEGANTEESQ